MDEDTVPREVHVALEREVEAARAIAETLRAALGDARADREAVEAQSQRALEEAVDAARSHLNVKVQFLERSVKEVQTKLVQERGRVGEYETEQKSKLTEMQVTLLDAKKKYEVALGEKDSLAKEVGALRIGVKQNAEQVKQSEVMVRNFEKKYRKQCKSMEETDAQVKELRARLKLQSQKMKQMKEKRERERVPLSQRSTARSPALSEGNPLSPSLESISGISGDGKSSQKTHAYDTSMGDLADLLNSASPLWTNAPDLETTRSSKVSRRGSTEDASSFSLSGRGSGRSRRGSSSNLGKVRIYDGSGSKPATFQKRFQNLTLKQEQVYAPEQQQYY
jgi:chromosome segregation ATPase